MKDELAQKIVEVAYAMIDEEPTDRLDYLNKALQLQKILYNGMAFLNELAASPSVNNFTEEDLALIHEAFCDSALPLVEMMDYFLKLSVREADRNPFAV